jgi:hypothetical protein
MPRISLRRSALMDDADDAINPPIVKRTISAAAAPPLTTRAPNSVFDIVRPANTPATPPHAAAPKTPETPEPQAKRQRASPFRFDPAAVVIESGRPIPPSRTAPTASQYDALLARMRKGDSVTLPHRACALLRERAKKQKIQGAVRHTEQAGMGIFWQLS